MNHRFKVLPLAGVIVACGSSNDAAPSGALADRVTVMGAEAADVDVRADRLIFPAATHAAMRAKRAGDVLVGDRGGAANPNGFLRKVRSVAEENGSIVVMTDAAALTDVIKEGTLQATLQTPTPGDTVADREVRPLGLGNGQPLTLLDYSGTKLLEKSGSVDVGAKTLGYAAHATVTKGTLVFTPSWDVGAEIHPDLSNLAGSVKELHVVATGQLEADLELDVGLALTGDATGDDLAQLIAERVLGAPSVVIAEYPVDLGHVSLGPLSIPVHADFKATLVCDLAYGGAVGVVVGGTASGSITVGFAYADGAMKPVVGHTATFTMPGPAWTMDAAVHARCSVKPEMELRFWDVAAAGIWVEPYVALAADATCDAKALTATVSGEAKAGATAGANATVDVFGLYRWEKACTLFDVATPPAKVSGTFALPGGVTAACASKAAADAPADAEPEACFGSGSGSGSGACPPKGDAPPEGWTCAPQRYGDCTCDCACGAPDMDCAAGACGRCTHDACTLGGPLGSTCTDDGQNGACIASICANDSYCCEYAWSASCVAHITNGDYACTKRSCAP